MRLREPRILVGCVVLEAGLASCSVVEHIETIAEDGVDLRVLVFGLAAEYLRALDSADPDRYLEAEERARLETLPGWEEALEECRRRTIGGILFLPDETQ